MISVLRSKKIITLIIDSLLLFESFILAFVVRYRTFSSIIRLKDSIPQVIMVLFIYVFIFYLQGLYTLQDIRTFSKRLQKTFISFLVASLFSVLLFYFLQNPEFNPKTILFLFNIFYLIQFIAWRQISGLILVTTYPSLKVAFLGWNSNLPEIISNTDIHIAFNMKFMAVFSEDENGYTVSFRKNQNIMHCHRIEIFEKLFKKEKYDILVVSPSVESCYEVREMLFNNLYLKASYISLAEFYEMVTAKIPIDSINQMWFLENLQLNSKAAYEKFKRVFDSTAALILIILTMPFWPIISLLIKITSPGPVFFKQERCGRVGKKFRIIKFRTMREENNNKKMTGIHDDRITCIGLFLRKTRLDEIPQLINILKGEMSFVGPRPERPELIEELEKVVPFYKQRMLVLPGLTGWDQVSGEYHSATIDDTYKKVQNDFYYLKNRSFYLDFIITLKTINTVFRRTGR